MFLYFTFYILHVFILSIGIRRDGIFESIWKLTRRIIQCEKFFLVHGFQMEHGGGVANICMHNEKVKN